MKNVSKRTLLVTAALLCAALVLMQLCAVNAPAKDKDAMLRAEEIMIACSARIRSEKEDKGIVIAAEDRFQTGLIGESYSVITTTLGPIEAKRTAADSSMAALMVRMLGEAGIRAGDKVAAGFSGSFPGLNIAVLAACEAMDVEITYICSAGASTFGANQPEMTFPDMVCLLYEEGLIKTPPAAYSMGGDMDIGADM
ncbi:MAG: poly-gamma-glutamate system protein, partial [Clostridia bacterium]|nr:poly-gamma-glutamate system protein [Clostridia bacterium]